jgi:hypothetical protein
MARTDPRTIGILRLKPGLLFQTTLSTWCDAMPLASTVVALAKELKTPELELAPRRKKTRLQQIDYSLGLLAHGDPTCALWERGTPPLLPRLSEGAWRLLEHKSYIMEATLNLCNATGQALESANCCSTNQPFQSSALRMASALRRTGTSLIAALPLFREDENVLLFLLQNHSRIDEALAHCPRKLTVRKSLNLLFPEGIPALEKQLRRRFLRRGFPEVIPIIQEALTTLTRPCPADNSSN